jgi:hypothetical protein
MNIGRTIRIGTSRARATYRPDWDPKTPWVLYWNGAAQTPHVGSEYIAALKLRSWGCTGAVVVTP